MKHIVRSSARADIIRQSRHYMVEADKPDVALRFVAAVRETMASLCQMPEIGKPQSLGKRTIAPVRSWPVKDFEDFRVYYVVHEGLVRVVRVLHGKRDVAKILGRDARRGVLQ